LQASASGALILENQEAPQNGLRGFVRELRSWCTPAHSAQPQFRHGHFRRFDDTGKATARHRKPHNPPRRDRQCSGVKYRILSRPAPGRMRDALLPIGGPI
jgi:hypothetical protein